MRRSGTDNVPPKAYRSKSYNTKNVNTETFAMVAKTFQGLEDVLAEEIKNLGGENIEIGCRMVSFSGNQELLYKTNLACRTALRILVPVYTFSAGDPDEVYEALKKFEWETYLSPSTTFAIDSVVYSDDFRHSKFVTYRAKDAIADYFNEREGKRPSVRLNGADVLFNLHISQNSCTLSLDSSGESLHKRGYRVGQTEAPINEVLAAGMILKSGWHGEKNFVDPMCGSGTILVEAALIATNTYPGMFRKSFAFERWKDFDSELLEQLYNDDSHEREFAYKIYGSDISPKAIEIATQNVKSAGVSKYVELTTMPLQRYETAPENGILITNPPYGERISTDDLLGLYGTLGEKLKHVFTGYDAWVISYREECFDRISLKPAAKIALMNGALECEFRKYEIFEGKYKEFKRESGGFREKARLEEKETFRRKEYKPANTRREERRSPRREYDGNEERRTFTPRKDRQDNGERRFAPRDEYRDNREFRGTRRQDEHRNGDERSFRPRRDEGRGERKESRGFRNSDREPERNERIHGEDAFRKFVTFKKPSLDPLSRKRIDRKKEENNDND